MSMEGIRQTIVEVNHDNYHMNPKYDFQDEKTTARLIGYEQDVNSDVEYQITDDDATRWLYGALLALLIITIFNLFLL